MGGATTPSVGPTPQPADGRATDTETAGPPPSSAAQVQPGSPGDERLHRLLDVAATRCATLITAPAGYGKTRLVEGWLRSRANPDDALIRPTAQAADVVRQVLRALTPTPLMGHLGHLVHDDASLVDDAGRLHTGAHASLISLLADRRGSAHTVVALDIAGDQAPVRVIADLASAFIDVPASTVHLVVAARARPHPLLMRLEAAEHLTHIDEVTLALTKDEVHELLAGSSGAPLPPHLVAHVTDLMEGWPLGVVMAARQLEGAAPGTGAAQPGVESALRFLDAEVVSRLEPEDLRALSIARTFSELPPALAGHLARDAAVQEHLWSLRERSCFVQTTRGGTWLRLHPLLRLALQRSRPHDEDRDRDLLLAGSSWFIERSFVLEALRCLIDARQWQEVETFTLTHGALLVTAARLEATVDLFEEIPSHHVAMSPVMDRTIAALQLLAGRVFEGAARLSVSERHPDRRMEALALRTWLAPHQADQEPILRAGEQAYDMYVERGQDATYGTVLSRTQTRHYLLRLRGALLASAAYGAEWRRVAAHDQELDSTSLAELPPLFRLPALQRQAAYHALAGRILPATSFVERARRLIEEHPDVYSGQPEVTQLATIEVLRSQGRHGEAEAALVDLVSISPPKVPLNHRAWTIGLRAHLAMDRGDAAKALEIAGPARDELGLWPATTFHAMIVTATARAHLALGDVDAASADLAAAPSHPSVRSSTVLTALARGDPQGANEVLSDWSSEPTPIGELQRKLAIAAWADATADGGAADAALRDACHLADSSGLVQPFLDLGPRWEGLRVRAAAKSPIARVAVERSSPSLPTGRLTPSEAAVMVHLAQGVTLGQIGGRLHLSTDTVKSHVRSIYRKLDVHSRAEAVARWRSLATAPTDDGAT